MSIPGDAARLQQGDIQDHAHVPHLPSSLGICGCEAPRPPSNLPSAPPSLPRSRRVLIKHSLPWPTSQDRSPIPPRVGCLSPRDCSSSSLVWDDKGAPLGWCLINAELSNSYTYDSFSLHQPQRAFSEFEKYTKLPFKNCLWLPSS